MINPSFFAVFFRDKTKKKHSSLTKYNHVTRSQSKHLLKPPDILCKLCIYIPEKYRQIGSCYFFFRVILVPGLYAGCIKKQEHSKTRKIRKE